MRSVERQALVRLDGARRNAWAHRIVATAVLSASLVTVLLGAPIFGLTEKVFGASDERNATATAIKSGGQTAVLFRGERYDARQFLRALFFELAAPGFSDMIADRDMDVSAANVQGFNGEIAHDVKIRFSERQREILEFLFVGKIGQGDFKAEIRNDSENRREIYLEAEDAGALFRFTNVYRHGENGRVRIVLNIDSSAGAEHEGVIDLEDFKVSREPILRFLTPFKGSKRHSSDALSVSHSRRSFTLASEDVVIKHGTAVGPLFGATISGKIDLAREDVKLRGVIVPLFGSDPAIFRPAYLDPPETLISLNYGIEGRPEARSLRLDPFGPLAPALLRELFASEKGRR
jgi:hypothetical protein